MSEEMVKRRMALGSKFKAGLDAGSVLVCNEFFWGDERCEELTTSPRV
jgi:hypothetical protein